MKLILLIFVSTGQLINRIGQFVQPNAYLRTLHSVESIDTERLDPMSRFFPVMVSTVPPDTGPRVGVIPLTTGI